MDIQNGQDTKLKHEAITRDVIGGAFVILPLLYPAHPVHPS